MKQITWLILTLAAAGTCASAAGQERSSRESSGIIKPAPDKPPSGHTGAQGTPIVPEPARESTSSSAMPDFCASADREGRAANNELSPAPDGRVIGKGRLHFHAAPKTGCREGARFIIPGDVVVARRRHGEWLLIDYVSRDGITHSAWVAAARIDLTQRAAKQ